MKIVLCVLALIISGCIIEDKVADDMVSQYLLSVKGGDKIEICVRASFVVAAFNQAKDEVNYLKWKKIEKSRCNDVGISK